MAEMAIRFAKEPRPPLDARRGEFLLGRRETADTRADAEVPRTLSIEIDREAPAHERADAEARL